MALAEIIRVRRRPRGFARRLHGRQKQADQDADDGDDSQQFDECETM
jgi:hypothetical protein